MDTINAEILRALRAKFGGNPQAGDSLAGLGVDSLGMAELSYELEKRFGVRVGEDVLGVETVDELVEYIRSKAEQLEA